MEQMLPVGGRDAIRRDADAMQYLPRGVVAGAGLGVGKERGEVSGEDNLAGILGDFRERVGIALRCESQDAQLEFVVEDGEFISLDDERQFACPAAAIDCVFKLGARYGDIEVGISLGIRQGELESLVEVSGRQDYRLLLGVGLYPDKPGGWQDGIRDAGDSGQGTKRLGQFGFGNDDFHVVGLLCEMMKQKSCNVTNTLQHNEIPRNHNSYIYSKKYRLHRSNKVKKSFY